MKGKLRPKPVAKHQLPSSIVILGLAPKTSSYQIALAIAKIMEEKVGLLVTPRTAANEIEKVVLLNKGEADMSLLNSYNSWKALRGLEEFKKIGPSPIRMVMSIFTYFGCFLVREDSGIRTMSDLKGSGVKLYAIRPGNVVLELAGKAQLYAHGIKWQEPDKDVELVEFATVSEALDGVKENRAAGMSGFVDRLRVEEMSAGGSPVYALDLGNDPAKLEKAKKYWPIVRFVPMKKNPEMGVPRDMTLWGHDLYLIIRADASEDLAYLTVKTIVENRKELEATDVLMRQATLEHAVSHMSIPFHPGVVKYYKERGAWTAELEAKQKELLELSK